MWKRIKFKFFSVSVQQTSGRSRNIKMQSASKDNIQISHALHCELSSDLQQGKRDPFWRLLSKGQLNIFWVSKASKSVVSL